MFEVDPLWPKPLPNHWLLGSTIGVFVDPQDHVWIIHRSSATLNNNERGAEITPPTGECCAGAPPVLEFDAAGNLLRHWGGPGQGYEWPQSNHGITIDHKGNVWIGGNGAGDSHILKFTQDGKFLAQYGRQNVHKGPANAEGISTYPGDSRRPDQLRPRGQDHHRRAGQRGLHLGRLSEQARGGTRRRFRQDETVLGRVRQPARRSRPRSLQSGRSACAAVPQSGALRRAGQLRPRVCLRSGERQDPGVPKDGTFVKEQFIAKRSLGEGSVWDIAFSRDPQQTYLYLADGRNMKVHVLRRDTLEELTAFGDGGRQPGQFFGVHSIAVDSKGNIYTTETYEGKRVQKFVYKGIGDVPRNQGVIWPRSTQ